MILYPLFYCYIMLIKYELDCVNNKFMNKSIFNKNYILRPYKINSFFLLQSINTNHFGSISNHILPLAHLITFIETNRSKKKKKKAKR